MGGKRPESVLVVIHTRGGEVLLLRRADREPAFWQSVTGSLESGETPRTAAVREAREETGLSAENLIECRRRRRFFIPPSWRGRFESGVTHNLEHEFRLELPAPMEIQRAPAEHDAHCWLPRAEAVERAASWTNRAAIRSIPVAPSEVTVVLVHGLWLGPHSMRPLARRLRAAGFATECFRYRSTRESPAQAARRLAAFIERLDASTIHLVAHSLGGIVLAHMLSARAPGRIGRAVLLGSPMRGAAAAGALRDRGLGRWLGRAREQGLYGGAPGWPREVPVAVVAGVIACGPIRVLLRLTGPHDGTVTVRETATPGAQRFLSRVTHFGLLFSRRVADTVITYLEQG
ncbi:MAG: dihydroneopterin triphosphate diphosphatase, partial [Halofilum sp. (in: g-proteobacteria)]